MTVLFNTLWTNHPAIKGIINPCSTNGVSNFSNQCAIRMSVCLKDSGVDLSSFRGAKCYPGHDHNQSHILRAEELAEWIEQHSSTFGTPTKKSNVKSTDYTKKGIALFKNFWGQGNQGDHIDLWNGSIMTRGAANYFSVAEEVWFWELV